MTKRAIFQGDINPGEPDTITRSFYLQTAPLSLAASAELARRVKAGEDETTVKLELLRREGKLAG